MKNNYLVIGIIVAIVIIGGIILNSKNKLITTNTNQKQVLDLFSKKITAKQAYNIALIEAKKFSSDSFLVDLNTSGVQSDGTSRTWYVMFRSLSKQTNFKVNVVEGKVDQTDDSYKKKTDQIPENWIDSNQVANITIPKCGTVIEDKYFFNLDAGINGKPAQWHVSCKVGENKTLYIDINALNGEYIKTRKAGIGW